MPVTRPHDADLDFTYDHYREILQQIAKTHKFLSFKDARKLGDRIVDIPKFCIMRHDIEFNLEWALRLAEIDAEEGAHSTFFLLQTSEYNPFEEEQAIMVRRILELGHDIGLHYDAALFERLDVNPEKVARQQIKLFEVFFETTIHAMSSHMPMRSGKTFYVDDVIDTYDPLYMTKMKYITDSTQGWRAGVVTRHLAQTPKIHLLTHDFTWSQIGSHWEANLLLQVKDDMNVSWQRATERIDQFREGLAMRKTKDVEFKKRFMKQRKI